MSIGSKIRTLRMKKGLTQRQFGVLLGFNEKNADVRVAHYESDLREPREDMLKRIAEILCVNIEYLSPDTGTAIGKIQALFEMENEGALHPEMVNGDPVLSFRGQSDELLAMQILMCKWIEKAEQLRNGEITREEYDQWRYQFPK